MARESLEKWVPEIKSHADLVDAIEKAFDYRGDVTIVLKSGEKVVGYIYNRDHEAKEPFLEYYPKGVDEQKSIKYSEIAGLEFSGVDPATGRSWELWVKKYNEKKKALAEGRDIGNVEPKPTHEE